MKVPLAGTLAKTLGLLLILVHLRPASAEVAGPVPLRTAPGWVVVRTSISFERLTRQLDSAIASNGMNPVNSASASDGARAQGITIPGNRVVGVFRNDFARRMLAASVPAGIEAPIRIYLTENSDGTSTLAYRTPSAVFAPYAADAGPALTTLANELDGIFERIEQDAIKP